MKRNLNILLTIATLAAATVASSTEYSWLDLDITPYIGAEAGWRRVDFRKGLGDNLFDHDFPQGNIFFGVRINPYLGFEAGYESTRKKQRLNVLAPGDVSTGIVVPDSLGGQQYFSKSHYSGPHINVMGFLPVCQGRDSKIDFIGSIGLVFLKANYVRDLVAIGGIYFTPITRTFVRRKALVRLGVGAQSMVWENLGVRLMVNWENTAQMKLTNREVTVLSVRPKNSFIYNFGIFVTF